MAGLCGICGQTLVSERCTKLTCSDRCRQLRWRRGRVAKSFQKAGLKKSLAEHAAASRHPGRAVAPPPGIGPTPKKATGSRWYKKSKVKT